jgi:flagellar biosynthesis/type III secretory pathway M-ring protein FliF/YscJ
VIAWIDQAVNQNSDRNTNQKKVSPYPRLHGRNNGFEDATHAHNAPESSSEYERRKPYKHSTEKSGEVVCHAVNVMINGEGAYELIWPRFIKI